jgi:hypothetical protein
MDAGTECLLEELVDGAFDDDEPFFLERKFEAAFHIFVALALTNISGFSTGSKAHKESICKGGILVDFFVVFDG